MSNKKKGTVTNSKAHTGHQDIRESFASAEPQDTNDQGSAAPQPAQARQTKPFPESLPKDPNTLISITQHHQPTDSTPPVVSPSRLTRKRAKEHQREQDPKPLLVRIPTPPTSTDAKRRSSQTQPPTLDNVTTRWRHLTRGIPVPDKPGESRATESKSRKLTDSHSTMTAPFSASGQKAVTPSAPVGGNENNFDQDDLNETMGMHQIDSKSKTSRIKKTVTRGQR